MDWRIIILLFLSLNVNAQLKKPFKFSTFYIAANGGTSLANENVYSVNNSYLSTDTIITPFDYSLTLGIRKIKRFGYEDRRTFKDGTEAAYGDAATIGLSPFEYLFEVDYRRQEGIEYLDQQHFIRYVKPVWMAKVAYIKEGFADIEYFEASERYRHKVDKQGKLSLNMGGKSSIY